MLGHDITPINVDGKEQLVRVLHGKDSTGNIALATYPRGPSFTQTPLSPSDKLVLRISPQSISPPSGEMDAGDSFLVPLRPFSAKLAGNVATATLTMTPPNR